MHLNNMDHSADTMLLQEVAFNQSYLGRKNIQTDVLGAYCMKNDKLNMTCWSGKICSI